ncbi:MAG: glycosyltransferase family 2 protein [Nitriliruptoraceae bacterium]|nr:glycosyltransferase family 2 protein [Nitriliruptoraceae bacterium]
MTDLSGSGIDVSIVLPVHNERGHLVEEVERIRAAMEASGRTYELIVVDDGSTDGSGEVASELGGLRLITLRDNRGSGAARRAGSRAARGDVVVWTDVDMTYPNDRIPWLLDQLEDHDQIVGARTSEEGTHKFARVPAKFVIRRLASYLVEREIPDLNSGFRAFRRDVGDQFLDDLPDGFSCVTTLTMSFMTNGYSVRYVDIPYAERAGRSKFHWWADSRRYLRQVVRMAMSYNPLRVFMPVGLLLLALACAKLAYDWVTRDFSLSPNTLLIFLVAFQVTTTGLLADLVARGQRRDRLLPSARIQESLAATGPAEPDAPGAPEQPSATVQGAR